MKSQLAIVNTVNFVVFVIFSLIVTCCKPVKKRKSDLLSSQKTIIDIKQGREDLLNGVSNAVCYSGFRSGQHPDRGDGAINPTSKQVLEDLQIISQDSLFRMIRLYDSGDNSEMVLRTIKENNLNMKVLLGIWLKAELSNHESCVWLKEPITEQVLKQNRIQNMQEINRGIKLAVDYPEIVCAVNVGNESLVDWNDHKVDVDTIISYVRRVKKSIKQPVTVADNYEWWASKGAGLASEVDFVSIHVYPIWEGKDIDEAMSYTIANVQKVRNALPKSKIVISEAGWATVASEFKDRASELKQQQYLHRLMEWTQTMNITTFFFEAFDEDWKGDPNNMMGAEKHWGLFYVDRKPKMAMQ